MPLTTYFRLWYCVLIITSLLLVPSPVAPVRAQTRALTQQQVRIAAGYVHSLGVLSNGTVVGWGSNFLGQTTIPSIINVVAIAAGYRYSLALKSNGTVVGWGDDYFGLVTDTPTGLTNVVAIAAGWEHALALKSNGTVVGWGSDYAGQSTIPAGLSGVVSIAAGESHSLALKSNGTVVGWGKNYAGQITIPAGLSNVVAIAAGYSHSLALKSNGTVVGWGSDDEGQSTIPAGLTNVVAIAAGTYHSLALKSNGTVVGWGDEPPSTPPTGLSNVVAIAASGSNSLALKSDGTVVGWGWNENGQLPLAQTTLTVDANLTTVMQPQRIAAGSANSLGVLSDGTVLGWGENSGGFKTIPVGLRDVVAISAASTLSLALKTNGTVVGWGQNEGWGLRDIPSLTNVVAIAAGKYHSLALKSNGTVVGWGRDNEGQSTIPAGLTNVVAIAVGTYHSLALRRNGTVVAWGENSYGETTVPTGLTNVVAIAAGYHHSLALKSNGTVIGWGWNDQGQTSVPFELTNVIAIAAGGIHSLALNANGTVIAWGCGITTGTDNTDNAGQCTIPSGLTNVVAIAAGDDHSLALKSDGTVIGWGSNGWGQSDQQSIGALTSTTPITSPLVVTPSTTTLVNTTTSQAIVTIQGMQANESFTVSYRNGAVYTNGLSNFLGQSSFPFNSLLVGRYTLDIVTTSGKRASVTFNVNAVGASPAAQPCSIKQVKPSTDFRNVIIYGTQMHQTYDVFIEPGNATSITTTLRVNNTIINQQTKSVGSQSIMNVPIDVTVANSAGFKPGNNELSVDILGNNGCRNQQTNSVYAATLPPFITIANIAALSSYQTELEIEIPPRSRYWEKFEQYVRFMDAINDPAAIIKLKNALNQEEKSKPFSFKGSIKDNKLKVSIKKEFDKDTDKGKIFPLTAEEKRKFWGLEFKLAVQAELELELWNPTNSSLSQTNGKFSVEIEGETTAYKYSYPLVPYLANFAVPGASVAINTFSNLCSECKKFIADRAEFYVEMKPSVAFSVAYEQEHEITKQELNFMLKGKLPIRGGFRSDLWILKLDAHLEIEGGASYKWVPYQPRNNEAEVSFGVGGEITAELLIFKFEAKLAGKCVATYDADWKRTSFVCGQDRAARAAVASWQLANRPATRLPRQPRALGDNLTYDMGSTHDLASSALAVAPNGNAIMLWEYDDATRPVGQGYDIAYSTWNGTSWSTRALIRTDAFFDRAPAVTYLADGSVLAVWERYDNSAGLTTESGPDALSGKMGIVWSRLVNGTWSTPQWLSRTAGVNDIQPRLSQTATGAIATWARTSGSLLNSTDMRISTARFQGTAWQPSQTQPETFAALRDLSINVVNDTPVLSWSASTTISDTPQLYVSYVGTSAQRVNTTVHDARHPRVVGGTTPQLIWLDYDALNTAPLADLFSNRSDTIVRQTDIFTGGLQLDELVANRLSNGDIISVLSGARGGQRDISIIRYNQSSQTWGQPRPLTNDINIESSLSGAINGSGNVFVGYRNDLMTLQSTIVEGQPITVPVKLGTGIVAMRANLTRDVVVTIDTPVLQPNGTSVITATVSNTGDTFEQLASLTINGTPVSLSQTGTLAPGATRAIPLTLTQTQLGTAQTIAVTLTNGADDTPANNSVVLPAQIPALGLQLQSLIPQYDGTFLANWRTTNLSNIDVPTTTVRVAFSATTVVTGTIPPIPAGTSLDRTLLVPAQIQGASPAAQLFIDETNGISATQRLTLAVAPHIALELDTNTLAMDDTGTLTVTVFNNGMVTAPANLAQIRVYTRQNDGNDAVITSTNVLELLPLNASQYTLTVPPTPNRCGIYVRLDGLGVNISKNAATVPQSAIPCADFVAVANPENRLDYTFSNQSTLANPTSYLWTFGDGTTSTAAQPTHAFAAPGTYTVQLQLSNATTTSQFSRTLTIPVINTRIDGITDGQFTSSSSTAWWSTPSTLIGDWYGEDVTGSAYARMESDVVASTTVSQTITLTQHNPYLVFDMFTNSSESVCGNDKLQIYFGTQLLGQRDVCTDNDRLGWNTYAIRIPKTQGTTGKIRFVGVFNESIRSIIGIDNVTLMTQNNGVLDFATQPAPAPTPINTRTQTTTRTATNTRTATRSRTNTPTITPTATHTATKTRTITRSATSSRTVTATITRSNTRTATNTATPSNTRTSTRTRSNTSTRTNTRTRTNTLTRTNTRTATKTTTPSSTRTNTRTRTATKSLTPTRTP